MKRHSLLIWGTGLEGIWRVDVRVGSAFAQGYRQVTGPLQVQGGSVLLTSYDSLTTAAQLADVYLPERHEFDLLLTIPDGDYNCHIDQMFDPNQNGTAGDDGPDFVIGLNESTNLIAAWDSIPWFDA